jgi:protein CpxP
MKTSKTVLAMAAAGLLLAAGVLTSTAAPHAGRPDRSSHQMFSEQLHQQLNLQPDQDRQWQALKDEEKSLHKKMKGSRTQLRDTANAEFAKSRPDLAALSTAADAAHEEIYTARREFHQHALAFYSGLSPEQQLVVVNAIKEKRQQMGQWREKRHHHHSGEG